MAERRLGLPLLANGGNGIRSAPVKNQARTDRGAPEGLTYFERGYGLRYARSLVPRETDVKRQRRSIAERQKKGRSMTGPISERMRDCAQ